MNFYLESFMHELVLSLVLTLFSLALSVEHFRPLVLFLNVRSIRF